MRHAPPLPPRTSAAAACPRCGWGLVRVHGLPEGLHVTVETCAYGQRTRRACLTSCWAVRQVWRGEDGGYRQLVLGVVEAVHTPGGAPLPMRAAIDRLLQVPQLRVFPRLAAELAERLAAVREAA